MCALVPREQVQQAEIDELVEKRFGGSVPAFVAAFAKNRSLSQADIDELRRMIDEWEVR